MNGDLGFGADLATNFTLKPYDASSKGAVTFFDSEDCTGLSGRVYWDDKATMVTLNDLESHSIYFKEQPASVLLPPGYELEMWADAQFTKSQGVLSSHGYLNENGKVACLNMPDGIKSFEIRQAKEKPAKGRWVQSRYNSDINQTMSTGIDTSIWTGMNMEEILREIRASLSAGFLFNGDLLSSDFSNDE